MMFAEDSQLSFLLREDDDNFDEVSFKESMQKLLDQCTEVEQQLENNIVASGSGDGCKSK